MGLKTVLCTFFLATLLVFGQVILAKPGTSKPTPWQKLPFPVIDAHTHMDFTGKPDPSSGIMNSKEGFIQQAQEAGVKGFVCHLKTEKSEIPSIEGLASAFCAGIREKYDAKTVEEGLKAGRFKCIKIYLGYVYRYPFDEFYSPLYKLAETYKVPVVFHTGDTVTTDGKIKYADPIHIDEVAVDHRKVNFVVAHMGNPWFETASEVVYKNANVYGDVAALILAPIKKYPPKDIFKLVVDPIDTAYRYIETPEKLMFGTDWPLVDFQGYIDVLKKAIPQTAWKAFFHDNAAKVFSIDTQ